MILLNEYSLKTASGDRIENSMTAKRSSIKKVTFYKAIFQKLINKQ